MIIDIFIKNDEGMERIGDIKWKTIKKLIHNMFIHISENLQIGT